jgi:hypothetical protein
VTEDEDAAALGPRLAAALDAPADRVVVESADRLRLRLPDRTFVVERRDAGSRWRLTLRVDGETVSKFGLFETRAALRERAVELRDADVGYTVCCGSR